ncbi:calcium-binding protein [Albimonas pacifica]|uniref:Hemolysin-type calcium-binding repeat-containing protein n=1 Tax=Albimonas pacifica TaxID=1114924 RepID=A0A1I3CJM1_9RHOB|nr:hypothetical protein [Albimonas pacifica]SFH74800.1 Hemolysin-type calcium-binding repeat-containing protein [Albimonas pacifica]
MTLTFIGTDIDGFDAVAAGDMVVVTATGRLSTPNFGDAFDFAALSAVHLVVQGAIFAEDSDAVSSDSGSSSLRVTVDVGGSIIAGSDGVELNGDDHEVANAGLIRGFGDAAVQLLGDGGVVSNTGVLSGQRGISISGAGADISNAGLIEATGDVLGFGLGIEVGQGATIANTGTISAAQVGVIFTDGAGTLFNSGVIVGRGGTSVDASNEADVVRNAGGLMGDVILDAGDDVYVAVRGGFVDGTVTGGDGADRLTGASAEDAFSGGAGADLLRGRGGEDALDGGDDRDELAGGGGDDLLQGGAANDVLRGGAGDDVLDGDGGRDRLFGGEGADRFVFEPGEGIDRVFDFQNDVDLLDLSAYEIANKAAFKALTSVEDGDLVINLGGGGEVTLEGVKLRQILDDVLL